MNEWPPPESVLRMLGIFALPPNQQGYIMARCPFHKNGQEKNPSLSIHASRGSFHCFACGASGGSMAAFVMKSQNLSYVETLKLMNKRK